MNQSLQVPLIHFQYLLFRKAMEPGVIYCPGREQEEQHHKKNQMGDIEHQDLPSTGG